MYLQIFVAQDMTRQRVVVINVDPCSRPQRTVLEVRQINGNSSRLRAKDQRVVLDTSPGVNSGDSWTHRSWTVISTRGSDPNKETRQKKEVEQSAVSLDETPARLRTGILIISRTMHLELNHFDLIRLLLRSSRELESD